MGMKQSLFSAALRVAPFFCFYLLCAIGLQLWNGAYSNEFGAHPDEAGHYVTGLMVRDFLLSGLYGNPIAFAEQFYLHYPKVAIGHWPPFFYLLQAVWTILFSASRWGMMVFMASICAASACSLQNEIRKKFSLCPAVLAGLLFITLPYVQRFSSMLMAELLVALLCFWAVNLWAKYLETENPFSAVSFGLVASMAILTKGNAILLCAVPIFSVLLCRRTDLLQRKSFWLPLLVVLLLCGLPVWLTLGMVKNGWQQDFSLNYVFSALPFYLLGLLKVSGFWVALFALVGGIDRFRFRHSGGTNDVPFWAVHAALILSVLLFHSFIPSGHAERHLLTAVPSILLFFVAGVQCAARKVSTLGVARPQLVVAILLLIPLSFSLQQSQPAMAWSGFKPVVTELCQLSGQADTVFLLASDSVGDGMFVSEVAQQGKRPGHYALRTSKILATSRWDGSDYRLRFENNAEVHAGLQRIPIDFLIIDTSIPEKKRREDHLQVLDMVRRYPDFYQLLGTYPLVRKGTQYDNSLWVYRLYRSIETDRPVSIEIDMQHMLGRSLRQ